MSSSVKKAGYSSTKKDKTVVASSQAAAPIPTNPADAENYDVSTVGWNSLESKFYELKSMLSAPTSGLNANQARVQQKKAVSIVIGKLLDMAQQECRRLLVEGNAKAAVEGGLKTLKLKEEYYGHGSLQLVPAYFHLARTNQFMEKFKAAEEFLSLAQWTILRHPDAPTSLKAELHQTFGLLYAGDAKLDAALKQLTCATYYLCLMNGPSHILTSFGYFDVGNVFAAKGNMENAMAFYDKVKEIWHEHLSTVLQENLQELEEAKTPFATPAQFGEENLQDALKMFRGIVGLQTERYGRVHISTGQAEHVMGMFMLWNGDAVSAMSSLLKALEISKRVFGERHPRTSEIRSLMLSYGLQVPEDTSNALEDVEEEGESSTVDAVERPATEEVSPPEEAPQEQEPTDDDPEVEEEEEEEEEESTRQEPEEGDDVEQPSSMPEGTDVSDP